MIPKTTFFSNQRLSKILTVTGFVLLLAGAMNSYNNLAVLLVISSMCFFISGLFLVMRGKDKQNEQVN